MFSGVVCCSTTSRKTPARGTILDRATIFRQRITPALNRGALGECALLWTRALDEEKCQRVCYGYSWRTSCSCSDMH